MPVNNNIKINKMQGTFKMHESDKKWYVVGAGSRQQAGGVKQQAEKDKGEKQNGPCWVSLLGKARAVWFEIRRLRLEDAQ